MTCRGFHQWSGDEGWLIQARCELEDGHQGQHQNFSKCAAYGHPTRALVWDADA